MSPVEPPAQAEMTRRGLTRLFAPKSIAVVGASADPEKAGGALMTVLAGFPGAIYPINRSADMIGGKTAYPDVDSTPEPADLAIVAVPPSAVLGVLEQSAHAGVGAAVICTGGFAEAGEEGAALQHQIHELSRRTGLRVLGPNTSGFVAPWQLVHATFMPGVAELRPGHVAIIAQSGGVNLAASFMTAQRGLGLSLAVGIGNAVDVDFADVLDHVASDPTTHAVALHLEGVADGRRLMAAIRRTAAIKPVVAMKVGRSDIGEFAQSHTGAMVGDWAVAKAALEQAGAVVVENLTDLVDAVAVLSTTRMRPGARSGIGIVTGQAGPGLIITDALAAAGIDVPALLPETKSVIESLLPPLTYQANPVDTGRPGETFVEILQAVGNDPGIDGMIVYALQEHGTRDLVETLERDAHSLPPTVFVTGGPGAEIASQRAQLADKGIWTVDAPDRGAFAMDCLVTDARVRHLHAAAVDEHAGDQSTNRPGAEEAAMQIEGLTGHGNLDEAQGKAVLQAIGFATPRRVVCDETTDVEAAFVRLAKPVVVKLLDAEVTHKSAVGGVHLNVSTEADLQVALAATGAATSGTPRWLVEEQVGDGVELILGGVRDGSFGATVALGAGGTGVEWGQPPIVRTAPLTRAGAEEAVASMPPALLDAMGPSAVKELADLVHRLGALLATHPEVREIDVNPLRSTDQGLVALDAVIVLDDATGAGPERNQP
ncbi:CoA-binding protein [Nocardioides immobilis]|uniref:CoA-binding protein n=1 Tax=Nocardioides immobilis TaxID=2049295 RepID=A0A417Y6Q7_9ACTN|nr:acetate--CoA ligase family protein [Nocardioides immobilis]RHW28412.1 CoA-binding protein [Nocardioides immobilis]